MKILVITEAALDAAIIATKARGNVNASDCLMAQAAKIGLATPGDTDQVTVTDSGSFYLDTNKGTFEFEGGYTGKQAQELRGVIAAFGGGNYSGVRARLPLNIVVKQ